MGSARSKVQGVCVFCVHVAICVCVCMRVCVVHTFVYASDEWEYSIFTCKLSPKNIVLLIQGLIKYELYLWAKQKITQCLLM